MSQWSSLRNRWANRIRRRFSDAVEAILDVGMDLIAAKRELPHGEFEKMVLEDLGWHSSTARRLMAIARHPVLGNRAHVHVLPPSWGTLYELTKLPAPALTKAIREGRITPELSRSSLPELVRPTRYPQKIREASLTLMDLEQLADRNLTFGTIYADPPWDYEDRSNLVAAAFHYPTLPTEEIARLPVARLAAPNSHLHLWTTTAFLFESRTILEAWGFDYKGVLVWVKPQLGIGHYWRGAHEFLILGVRGRCHFATGDYRSWFEAPRGKHSCKPEIVRKMIEAVSPGPRLELFGRTRIPGWVVWGNEVEGLDEEMSTSPQRRTASGRS